MGVLAQWFAAVAGALIPSMNADPKKQYQWRVRVGLVLCSTFGGLCAVTVLAFGLAPAFFSGFAQADALDAKIQEAIKPIRVEQTKVGAQVSRIESLLIEQLVKSKAGELRETKRKFCKAEPGSRDRDQLQEELERLQDSYKALRGFAYAIPMCADL
jgi:flagellin-like hook-associated protein FlgL